jgi:hypothetical protein
VKDIVLQRAAITSITHKRAKKSSVATIDVTGVLTADIANVIGCRWLLFDKEQVPKAGYTAIQLDVEYTDLRMKFAGPAAAKIDKGLDFYVGKASKFEVYRTGGKKKAKRLMVSFKLDYSGPPFELIEFWLRGEMEGVCTLMPRQAELFDGQPAAAANGAGKTAAHAPKPKGRTPLRTPKQIEMDAGAAAKKTGKEAVYPD